MMAFMTRAKNTAKCRGPYNEYVGTYLPNMDGYVRALDLIKMKIKIKIKIKIKLKLKKKCSDSDSSHFKIAKTDCFRSCRTCLAA